MKVEQSNIIRYNIFRYESFKGVDVMKKVLLIFILIFLSACSDNSELNSDSSNPNADGACKVSISTEDDVIGELNGYSIMRITFEARCERLLGFIVVDGYDFGYFSDGCSKSLDWIGYYAEKDGETYKLQSLVDNNELKTKDIYELYICDEGRMGSYFHLQ